MKSVAIKMWMLGRGIKQSQIATEAGVSPALVSLVIKGARNNKKVRQILKAYGCPPKYLGSNKG